MSSSERSDPSDFDIARDGPTAAADVDALRRMRRETAPWFSLTTAEIEALIPEGALDRRPPMRPDAKPFTL
jgi:hypothetical protein